VNRSYFLPNITCMAMAMLLVTANPAMPADTDSLELAVKATFLYKFQFYITWPPRAFAAGTDPFNLCIVGDDPFGDLIDQAVNGQTAGGHRVAVRRLRAVSAADHCQMMYLATDDPQLARRELSAVGGLPVLTVTDAIDDDSAKGMINFVVADDRVRFEIDNAQAARNGLAVSSKLLGVALAVRTTP